MSEPSAGEKLKVFISYSRRDSNAGRRSAGRRTAARRDAALGFLKGIQRRPEGQARVAALQEKLPA
jgi:hypothetical protein